MDTPTIKVRHPYQSVVVMSCLIILSGCTDDIVGRWDSDSDCSTRWIDIDENLEGEAYFVFDDLGDCSGFALDARVDVIDRNSQYELQLTPSDDPDWENPETIDCSMESREDELTCVYLERSMVFMREGGVFD